MKIENDRGLDISLMGDQPVIDDSDTFCGNKCGMKCKRAAYERACNEAAKLAARLGPGWVGEVWENWGWNFSASLIVDNCVLATVRARKTGSPYFGSYTIDGYTAELRPTGSRPAQIFSSGNTETKFDTPDQAVRAAVAEARNIASNVGTLALTVGMHTPSFDEVS
jgi:hypothetical protein